MQKLVDHFKGDVVIFAVSHDNDEADLKNFLKAFKAEKQQKERTISIVWDQDRTIANRFAIEALPESFIIGVDMKLIRKVAGSENWYSPEAVAYFTNLLK